jgi:N-acetylmuramoyl-L-alanine amidase
MRKITHIVVHCTATPEGRAHTAEDIRQWHKQKGWQDIGYHWVVRLDGSIEPGRNEAVPGAHVANYNSTTIGVVYVGGIDKIAFKPKDTRTVAQKAALLKLLKDLKRRYPGAQILGHRDFPGVAKACPSFNAKTEYAAL